MPTFQVIDTGSGQDTFYQGMVKDAANWATLEALIPVGTTATQTLTNKTLTSPVINVGSDATGDIYYRSSGVFTRLAKGTAFQYLRMNSGATVPEWGIDGVYGLTDGATIAVDWNNGDTQYVTIAATGRTLTFANPREGRIYRLVVIQDGSGSRTITTWPTIKWAGGSAPTLTTTASRADIVTLLYCNSVYYADCSKNFYTA